VQIPIHFWGVQECLLQLTSTLTSCEALLHAFSSSILRLMCVWSNCVLQFELLSLPYMQVSTLPWPYTSQKQFEKTHCSPIGRHWNSEATFHQLIKPRVHTVVGAIIEPITLTEDVQDFMKRTEKRNRQQERRKQKLS